MNLFARGAPAVHNGNGGCPEIADRNLALEWARSYNALTNLRFVIPWRQHIKDWMLSVQANRIVL